ncbi:MAG: ABC transporter substrate-binding protein, partial [Albidovulum sp.]
MVTATRMSGQTKAALLGFGIVIGMWLAGAAGLRAADDVVISHGYSNFGELKYPADFTHLDYVNPDAPKGGEIS